MITAMHIKLGGLSFDALAAGPEGGEPVLLLHGWPEFADCWRPIMQALAGAGYRAVAVDQRGYSPDVRPLDVADYAMDWLVADTLGFADQLGWTTFISSPMTGAQQLFNPWCPASWPLTLGAPSDFYICISRRRCGSIISPRSWRIRTPIRRCSRHSSCSRNRWAWCRYG